MAPAARQACGPAPAVRPPLSPRVSMAAPSQPPSQQTQPRPAHRHRDARKTPSSSASGVRRGLAASGSDEENDDGAGVQSLPPLPAKKAKKAKPPAAAQVCDEENDDEAGGPSLPPPAKKAKPAKPPAAAQVCKDFIRSFFEATSSADKHARLFTRPPGAAERGTPFEEADWPQLFEFVAANFGCAGEVTSNMLWRAQAAVDPFSSRSTTANRSDTGYGPRDQVVGRSGDRSWWWSRGLYIVVPWIS